MKDSDLIRRSDALNYIKTSGWIDYPPHAEGMAEELTERIPAVDAVEVVHANWTRINYKPCGHDYECSACKRKNDRGSRYCPDCGARMDGSREDGDA